MQTMTHMTYRGYRISRGAYSGTTDDRLNRWYAWPEDGPIDRCGSGFATRKDAKAAVDAWHDEMASLETARMFSP
jgi:hypothetical protein